MSFAALATTLIGGFLVGFVFSIFKLPLPVPPLAGLIAAAACLAGSSAYQALQGVITRGGPQP
ncbi:MAG: XapX domain-containing protein [Vulcanococcus sp.]